jgi:acetylornithine deacetylase/succinyl-diaminopimelate desuccinylase-like protein
MPISADLNEAIIKLCQDLIRTPSVNGRDPERAVAERAADFARAHGLRADLPALDPHRPNLLVRSGPPGEAALLLVAHLDTVAEGEISTWHYPPFGGQIEHGRIYGRGACDTKGGLAAALGALVAATHRDLPFPILLAGVPDEEAGATGTLGIKYLHQMGLLSGRGAIYVYPGNREIVVGHRGVLRLVLRTHGRAFHSGSREWQDGLNGYNAVVGMAEILSALERLQFEDQSPGTLFDPFHTVITPTTIAGGNGPSMVPAFCEARVDIRLVPTVSREQVESAVRDVIAMVARRRPPLRVEVLVEAIIPTTQISPDQAIVQASQTAVQKVFGHRPIVTVSGPANESYLLNGFGIPTCIIGPDGGNAHAADEYVEIESLLRTVEVYTQVAAALA